jgi:hypothetical protein
LSSRKAYAWGLLALVLVFGLVMLAIVQWRASQGEVVVRFDPSTTWDSVTVQGELLKKSWFSDPAPVNAVVSSVVVRRASGDVLVQGQTNTVALDDASLGSNELLSVEVCMKALQGGDPVCTRNDWRTSEKRVALASDFDLVWPISTADYAKGKLRFSLIKQRSVRNKPGTWEDLSKYYDRVDIEAQTGGNKIILPLVPSDSYQVFQLNQANGFGAFAQGMDQTLATGADATVQFSVLQPVAFGGGVVATLQKVFHLKTQAEREQEVAQCVQAIAQRVVARGYNGGDAIEGQVRGNWRFDKATGVYTVDADIRWRGAITSIPYGLSGKAEFGENGLSAKFETDVEDLPLRMLRRLGTVSGLNSNELGDLACQ